ncbi:hypothetical protein HQN90_29260 [Paenibacillus alba]|uniref:hypothetical protein n=1 Tax=Paenibacillus alba TaxID=1197127 RepID=UPI00156700DB|nr:hypothetical protein [Paenibacillus alba]NQX70234.1 hypothetical protein [Paenibacillus alba]
MLTLKSWASFFNRDSVDVYHTVKVRAPRDFFNRAEVFIEDMKYTTNEELVGVNVTFIVKLLFDNFLDRVRQGNDLYDYLLDLRENYSHFLQTNSVLADKDVQPVRSAPKFQWTLTHRMGDRDYLTLNIGVHPREVNRIAVFFADWDCKYEISLDMDLNELVTLLFIEFISELRNGFEEETKKDIMTTILAKWEED